MPKGMLPNEPPVEGAAKRSGVKCVAVNGARTDKVGEKKAKFKRHGMHGINQWHHFPGGGRVEAVGVGQPWTKGHRVVFSRGAEGHTWTMP